MSYTMTRYWELAVNMTVPFAFLVALSLIPFPALAETNNPKQNANQDHATQSDTENWACEFCPFSSGTEAKIEIGAASISADSFKFGDYRGVDDKGVVLLSGLDLRFWGKEGAHWEVVGSDLGLDSRAIAITGGRQGRYEVWFAYDMLPKRSDESSRSPYLGLGSGNLTLPVDWVSAGGTAGMTGLTGSLHPMILSQDRENIRAGFTFHASSRLKYQLDYRHETRDGQTLHSGNFITFSALFPKPIDYKTDEIDAVMHYSTDKGHLRLSYYGSFFDSGLDRLVWDNPFTPLTAGSERGQSALPPDNQAHHLMFGGAYQVTERTTVSGSIAVGEMKQNAAFLPTTLNSALTTAALPATSLDGKVKTTHLTFRILSRPRAKLKINLHYHLNERDNQTAQKLFETVESDTFLAGTRTNLPYSFKRQNIDLKAHYRIAQSNRLSAGIKHDIYQRNFQEVSETDEDTLWLKFKTATQNGKGVFSFKFLHAERRGDYSTVTEIATVQNPLVRKYNLVSS